jgi:hypothetical protein
LGDRGAKEDVPFAVELRRRPGVVVRR